MTDDETTNPTVQEKPKQLQRQTHQQPLTETSPWPFAKTEALQALQATGATRGVLQHYSKPSPRPLEDQLKRRPKQARVSFWRWAMVQFTNCKSVEVLHCTAKTMSKENRLPNERGESTSLQQTAAQLERLAPRARSLSPIPLYPAKQPQF